MEEYIVPGGVLPAVVENIDVGEKRMKRETEENKRQCRKCLLRDMDKEAYFDNLYSYIANMDEDIKAEETLYEERLNCCKQCERLTDGMCRACGCFVELRAAVAKQSCPYDLW